MVSKATIWISGIAIALGLFVLLVERHLDSTREALHRARFLTLLEAGEISTVRVSSPGHRAVLERGEESWHLVSPLQDVADPEKLEHLLKQLCQLPLVEALAPAGVSEETLGFSKSNVIEVELEASGSEPRRILLGRSGPFDGTIYAKADTGPQAGRPCLVRFEGRGELASPLERLRDRRLLRVHPGAIRGYRLRTKAGEIVLRREEREPKWHIESPLQTRANDDIAFSLVEELTKMEAVSCSTIRHSRGWLLSTTGPRSSIWTRAGMSLSASSSGKSSTVRISRSASCSPSVPTANPSCASGMTSSAGFPGM